MRSELLEREAEAKRAQLTETFDELRTRVTPGHVVDRLVDYATEAGGADFFRNLRDQAVANPLALGIIGAGLAWLMLSNGREARRLPRLPYRGRGRIRSYFAGARDRFADARDRFADDARERFADARERAGDAMDEAAEGVRDRVADAAYRASDAAHSVGAAATTAKKTALEAASRWSEAAGSAGSSLRGAASSAYEQTRSRAGDTKAAFGDAVSAAYGGVAQSAGRTAEGLKVFGSGAAATSRDLFDFCREQPLVVAGLGIALGAALAAAFPSTETEDELMGEASEEFKERTRAFAQEQYEKSKSVAESALDKVQQKIGESGQPVTDHPSIVPSGEEGRDMQEPIRPERTGLRDERS